MRSTALRMIEHVTDNLKGQLYGQEMAEGIVAQNPRYSREVPGGYTITIEPVTIRVTKTEG